MTHYSLPRLRAQEYPWTQRGDVVYLNHASTGPLPESALTALAEWSRLRAQPWQISLERQFGVLVTSRELCARLIQADASEIAVMVNTSYGINLAARVLPLAPGDVVVSVEREFPANIYPWMAIERSRGVNLSLVPVRDRLAHEDDIIAALDRPGVKLLTVSWVSFETGKRLDLARLGAACKERGIYFVVDAIQGLGAAPLDVRACHIDILASGGQKWLLSPWGSGFAYVRRELVTQLEPNDTGWLSVRSSVDFTKVCDYNLDFFEDARRFEVITLPFQDFAGMNASLEMFCRYGMDRVHDHVTARATQIVEWAQRHPGVKLVTPADTSERAGIVSFITPDPVATSRALGSAGVSHSLREGAIRLSPHFYVSEEEVARALEICERA